MVVQSYQHKVSTLQDLYSCLSVAQSVVFVNKKRTAEQLNEDLNRDGHTVSMLHGEMETDERKRVGLCGGQGCRKKLARKLTVSWLENPELEIF